MTEVRSALVCKICDGLAPLHGVVDFNKTCETRRGAVFPLAGVPVWYHRCEECGFLFTAQFDTWSAEEWLSSVYNDGYRAADPDADGARPRANAVALLPLIRRDNVVRVLDYGGGDGALAALLREAGVDAVSWDPLRDDAAPAGLFPLVTAFEVMEHTPRPKQTARDALSHLTDCGMFLFSTLTLDDLPSQACDHWYIAPRNGHVSIHTTRSLARLFGALGWRVQGLGPGAHLARRLA